MKRAYDIVLSACGLAVVSPLLLVIAALIKLADGGAVFYRQPRLGLRGRPFDIWKFRTMVPGADRMGSLVTGDRDPRITGVGRILRKTKLDELPQLWNVLKGEMSLVGPRPEVAKYVERYTPEQRQILNLKPGVTDLASLQFRNEELLLKDAEDVEEFYVQHCIPRKLQLNLQYADKANLLNDTWIILQTICPYWICLLSVYSIVLAAAFWLSCELVYDFAPPPALHQDFVGTMFAVVAVQLGALIWRKQCKGLLSYFSLPELRQIATALGFACVLLLGLRALTARAWPSRNLILVNSMLSLCALGGFRLLLRTWRENSARLRSSTICRTWRLRRTARLVTRARGRPRSIATSTTPRSIRPSGRGSSCTSTTRSAARPSPHTPARSRRTAWGGSPSSRRSA